MVSSTGDREKLIDLISLTAAQPTPPVDLAVWILGWRDFDEIFCANTS